MSGVRILSRTLIARRKAGQIVLLFSCNEPTVRIRTGSIYAPLRSVLNEDPLDLQRPLTHVRLYEKAGQIVLLFSCNEPTVRIRTGSISAPLRSALNEDPLDLQRPLTHYCSLFSFSMCAAKCRRYIIRAYSVVIVINVFFVYRLDRTIPIVLHVGLLKGKVHCRQKRTDLV